MKRSYFSIAAVLALTVCCFVSAKAQSAPPPQTEEDTVYRQNEVDKRMEILVKPQARVDGQCKKGTAGTNIFNVVFHKSGKVTAAEMVQSSSCRYFDARAREAVRNILFNPAIKGGQPVSVGVTIEFRYRVF